MESDCPGGRPGPLCWLRRAGLGLLAYLVVGNLLLLGTSVVLQVFGPGGVKPASAAGINHFRAVDARVWRGGAPSAEGYQALLDNGVTTIVDLRAAATPEELEAPRRLGFDVVHLPVHDGQTPSDDLIRRLVDVVDHSEGLVFIHCQAGVGRTGSVAAAYQVWIGESSGARALTYNLGIGPPTLEQLAFTFGLRDGRAHAPPLPLIVASRVLDAPRQLWNTLLG